MGRGRIPSDASGVITKNVGLISQFESTNDGNDNPPPGQVIFKLAHPGILSLRRAILMAGGVTFKGSVDATESSATAAGIVTPVNKGDFYIVGTAGTALSLTSAVDSGTYSTWDKDDWIVADGTGKYFRIRNLNSTVETSGANVTLKGTLTVSGSVTPSADATHDLGSASKRFANIYTGDLHLKNSRGDWTIVEEEEYLCVVNNSTNKKYKMMLQELSEE